MRRLAWGFAVGWLGATVAVVSVCTAGTALAQGPRYRTGPDNGLLKDLFGSPAPKAAEGPKDDPKMPAKAERPSKPSPKQARAEEQERLRKTFLRRQAVCDRLREIAQDDRMRDEADRLEAQAWKVYQDQVKRVLAEAEKRQVAGAERAGQKPPRGSAPGRLRVGGLAGTVADRSDRAREDER
jgi:hypothetical protein